MLDREEFEGEDEPSYSVTLPCSSSDVGKFIAGLLGKPETISRIFTDPFEVTREDIENFHHLLEQRVNQQAEASLIQFTARIVYSDNSSVLLTGLETFHTYTEIRPRRSIAVSLSWIWLVKFPDKQFAERQQVDVDIDTHGHFFLPRIALLSSGGPDFSTHGAIAFTIRHTARTWGNDIESLLTGHIEGLMRPPNKRRKWATRHCLQLGLLAAFGFLLIALGGALYASHVFSNHQMASALGLSESGEVPKKIDTVIAILSSGAWSRFQFYEVCFLLLSLLLSVSFGIWVGDLADSNAESFLLLSKEAEKWKQQTISKAEKKWRNFLLSWLLGVTGGLLSNAIFALVIYEWKPFP